MGWYHLFYQYNQGSVVWGNSVRWAHAVSKDRVNWLLLPISMVPDHWYDINGVMTGSATILPDGRPMMLYSSMSNDFTQLQSVAYPKNALDPLLIGWVKYKGDPILYPPHGIGAPRLPRPVESLDRAGRRFMTRVRKDGSCGKCWRNGYRKRGSGKGMGKYSVEEVETLRSKQHQEIKDVELCPGTVVLLDIGSATQLDISASFKMDKASLDKTLEAVVSYNCTTSTGSAGRGAFGPFGLLVLADEPFTEQTPVYFYIAKNTDGTSTTYFCADESRSSKLSDVGKRVYGSTVPVLHGEDHNMRLLVDHSIVESFAQGGRSVITSRVYPTKAIYEAAKVFLFNNATGITVKASLKIWKMGKATFKQFPL
ncbi:hypothetical protein L1987_42619 [Smallanthus sonchifolius]|uniref:Uncharacterized protein n=1 Tax=Smallanthus sonchifolius TaxID=185202 RepID=A0ACB9GKC3_9ASTR|nr:hypothetical protein L1987_42619 [Smallanthus sonchifolius]